MIKEIRYSGITTTPNDLSCPDGDLDMVVGLASDSEGNSLTPILPERHVMDIPSGYHVVAVHETSRYKHYICYNGSRHLGYIPEGGDRIEHIDNLESAHIIEVTTIGNTIMVLTHGGMLYYLYKPSGYLALGSEMPELPITFGLVSKYEISSEREVRFDPLNDSRDAGLSAGYLFGAFSDSNKSRVSEPVLALVNKFIAEEVHGKGRFIFPFFVRYAYRLYDGTITRHSPPVLMITSTRTMPTVSLYLPSELSGSNGATSTSGGKVFDNGKAKAHAMVHELDYGVPNVAEIKKTLERWSDIITSVDIFISEPVYSYDQGGLCTQFMRSVDKTWGIYYTKEYPVYGKKEYSLGEIDDKRNIFVKLPEKSAGVIESDIRDASRFYYIKSVRISELPTDREVIKIDKNVISTLATRELMSDDYDSHTRIMPAGAFVYNGRVNIFDIRKDIACHININAFFAHYTDSAIYSLEAMVCLRKDGREIVVKLPSSTRVNEDTLRYFYYPDPDAYKLILHNNSDNFPHGVEIPLERHPFLNGAVYFKGWGVPSVTSAWFDVPPELSSESNRIVHLPNRIYTSEVNNPFFFPLLGINAVGTGRVIGLSTAARALSQGQFGQFPLYAFTDEGVWALEVSEKGTYRARQPITRDVCISRASITQIDTAVLFISRRGIMLLSGADSRCISDDIERVWSSTSSTRNHRAVFGSFLRQVQDKFGAHIPLDLYQTHLAVASSLDSDLWRMIYDYARQRIIVYQTIGDSASVEQRGSYAYVYGLRSKRWTMMQTDIATSVPSYPEALAMTHNGKLVDLSGAKGGADGEPLTGLKGVLITRPIKLDMPDVLKTFVKVYQRGNFRRGSVKSIIYGSQDLSSWHLIASRSHHRIDNIHGTGYRYLRIVLICDLEEGESIQGCSIEFMPKQTNRLR